MNWTKEHEKSWKKWNLVCFRGTLLDNWEEFAGISVDFAILIRKIEDEKKRSVGWAEKDSRPVKKIKLDVQYGTV